MAEFTGKAIGSPEKPAVYHHSQAHAPAYVNDHYIFLVATGIKTVFCQGNQAGIIINQNREFNNRFNVTDYALASPGLEERMIYSLIHVNKSRHADAHSYDF